MIIFANDRRFIYQVAPLMNFARSRKTLHTKNKNKQQATRKQLIPKDKIYLFCFALNLTQLLHERFVVLLLLHKRQQIAHDVAKAFAARA